MAWWWLVRIFGNYLNRLETFRPWVVCCTPKGIQFSTFHPNFLWPEVCIPSYVEEVSLSLSLFLRTQGSDLSQVYTRFQFFKSIPVSGCCETFLPVPSCTHHTWLSCSRMYLTPTSSDWNIHPSPQSNEIAGSKLEENLIFLFTLTRVWAWGEYLHKVRNQTLLWQHRDPVVYRWLKSWHHARQYHVPLFTLSYISPSMEAQFSSHSLGRDNEVFLFPSACDWLFPKWICSSSWCWMLEYANALCGWCWLLVKEREML